MDRFEAMRVFIRVVERRSFTFAAQDVGIPRSTATQIIKQLEARLGVRLLQRTTRTVSPTLDGEAYYRRCMAIIDDVEDAEGAFGGAKPKGMLRIEVQGTLARHFLMPGIPDFFSQYPEIEISMSESDRYVDIVREGVDCVLRFGALPDSDMVARRVGLLNRMTYASPDYIARYGMPADFGALSSHQMVGLRRLSTGALEPLQFEVDNTVKQLVLRAPMSVTGPESYILSARLGLGLVQMPNFHAVKDIADGTLVRVLPDIPPPRVPVSLLYPPNRQLSPRVRLFLDWAAREFEERNDCD